MAELHIIEPTLADQTGHCHSYVQSLIEANQQLGHELHLWLDQRGTKLCRPQDCQSHPYFSRRLRKLQKFCCLRRLIRAQKVIFIPTAGRIDFVLLDWLLRKKLQKQRQPIFLHFHQFKISVKKIALLKKIAQQYKNFIILAPTQPLLNVFRENGFTHCELVPCPGYAPQTDTNTHQENYFEKVIYAGAARSDKGFPELVKFVEYLAAQSQTLPLSIQVSPPHSGRYDEKSEKALQRLQQISLPNLTLYQQTLDKTAYQNLFHHAICLLIYDPISYRDKFSGVALDAFYAGCPVIVVSQTWAGEMTQRFQAGIVIADRDAKTIFQAVQKIRENYAFYQQNAKQASVVLQREHDPINTWRVIEKYLQISEDQ
jgi:glycosyltransferase involved in cell wall biosynthesis